MKREREREREREHHKIIDLHVTSHITLSCNLSD